MNRMSNEEAEAFVSHIGAPSERRPELIEALVRFPEACQSRGMFADGVLKMVKQQATPALADEIRSRAGYPPRIMSFGLYPHRDFYLLFYQAARALYPLVSLEHGMRRVAETFYPIFATSLAGRTMVAMLGRTPRKVLERFVDAYRIATPWNEHRIERATDSSVDWSCKVEPCPLYEYTFSGICTGMVEGATGVRPKFELLDRRVASSSQSLRFRITW